MRDLLDTCVHAPGCSLELQTPVFVVELTFAALCLVEFGEQFACAMLGGDEPERAADQNQEEEEVQLCHASGPMRLNSVRS